MGSRRDALNSSPWLCVHKPAHRLASVTLARPVRRGSGTSEPGPGRWGDSSWGEALWKVCVEAQAPGWFSLGYRGLLWAVFLE